MGCQDRAESVDLSMTVERVIADVALADLRGAVIDRREEGVDR